MLSLMLGVMVKIKHCRFPSRWQVRDLGQDSRSHEELE